MPADNSDDWLLCRNPEWVRSFLTLYPAELMAAAAMPPPVSAPKAKEKKEEAAAEVKQMGLF